MKSKNPLTKIELFFWDSTIRLLSNPNFTRLLLGQERVIDRSPLTGPLALLFALTGAVGLLSGYLCYFVVSGLR